LWLITDLRNINLLLDNNGPKTVSGQGTDWSDGIRKWDLNFVVMRVCVGQGNWIYSQSARQADQHCSKYSYWK